MSSTHAGPSSVDGIKRLAKRLGQEGDLKHHLALDHAAQRAGYQNFRHAQRTLGLATGLEPRFPVYLTAYWRKRAAAGRETLLIHLSKPLDQLIARHELPYAARLRFFKLEATDHLERRVDLDEQEEARHELFSASRVLRFLLATGLRPATTQRQARSMRRFGELPSRDHMSEWIHRETGAWVFMDEPYAVSNERKSWVRNQGIQMVTPEWPGLHNPSNARPHLFCSDEVLATRLTRSLADLQETAYEPKWDGESAPYRALFESPSRQTSGRKRSVRPMPAYHGIERVGALPYGANRGGESSLWRPARRMPLALHMRVGPLLHALGNSELPTVASRIVQTIRSRLDDWVQMEYPSEEEMAQEQFRETYYGVHRKPLIQRTDQIRAMQQVQEILREGYDDSPPLRLMLRKLERAGALLAEGK